MEPLLEKTKPLTTETPGFSPTPEMVSAILAILMSIYQLYKSIKK